MERELQRREEGREGIGPQRREEGIRPRGQNRFGSVVGTLEGGPLVF